MTRNEFEIEIRKMIDNGENNVEEVAIGSVCFTFNKPLAVNLNCNAILTCDKIAFDNYMTDFFSLYRHGVYFGMVDVKEVRYINFL